MEKIVNGRPNIENNTSYTWCFRVKKPKEYIMSKRRKPIEQIDWSENELQKSEYDSIMARIKYIKAQEELGGFPKIKMVEGCIESYLQILLHP